MKPFFIHRHHGPGKLTNRFPRGFTMLVSPSTVPNKVEVQTAWCSPKDQFCKATGRSEVVRTKVDLVNKRALPAVVALNEFWCNLSPAIDENAWQYLYKYML